MQPKGEPTNKQSMRVPEADVMKIMLAVQAYIQAYEAAHHHRLVAAKVRELQDKLAERAANGTGAPRATAPAAADGASPLRVVREAPSAPAPLPARERGPEPAPRVDREQSASRAPAPVPARPAPVIRPAVAPNGARPTPTVTTPAATLRPQPQSAGNAALAVAPEMDEAPPARTPLRSVESTRPAGAPMRPSPTRPAPTAAPTTAARPASAPTRPFRSSTGS